jgi:uncharacterized protein involved in type VI secretion and phage assembly
MDAEIVTLDDTSTQPNPNAALATYTSLGRGTKRHQPSLSTLSDTSTTQESQTLFSAFTIMKDAAATHFPSTKSAPKKRAKQESSSKMIMTQPHSTAIGFSQSNVSEVENRALCISGQFQVSEIKWDNFVQKIKALDADATFDADDPRIVYCSKCKAKVMYINSYCIFCYLR